VCVCVIVNSKTERVTIFIGLLKSWGSDQMISLYSLYVYQSNNDEDGLYLFCYIKRRLMEEVVLCKILRDGGYLSYLSL